MPLAEKGSITPIVAEKMMTDQSAADFFHNGPDYHSSYSKKSTKEKELHLKRLNIEHCFVRNQQTLASTVPSISRKS